EWRSTAIHLPGILSREEKGRGGQVCWPGDQVRLNVGMETSGPVKLKLGVATKCAGPATKCGSMSEWKRQFR
ncbi:MAG: hypothetical protein SGI72_06890, partial [Planctomycetota bacterium]|nr:hypothetical protein [Planctomycetota bacterium]